MAAALSIQLDCRDSHRLDAGSILLREQVSLDDRYSQAVVQMLKNLLQQGGFPGSRRADYIQDKYALLPKQLRHLCGCTVILSQYIALYFYSHTSAPVYFQSISR